MASARGLGQTAFIIPLSVEGIREARAGLRISTIECDSPARQGLRRLQGFCESSTAKIRRLRLRLGEPFVATRKARIEIDGLLKAVLCERTVLRVRNAINAGKIKAQADLSVIPVLMGLEGEEGYPHRGSLNFINNAVNPTTGTIAVRGKFDNPRPPNGRRLMSPGMFVRIRLPIGQPYPALLVIDRAIGSDQGWNKRPRCST